MADSVSTNLAHNIRRLREARNLTQQQMSTLAGIPRPTWANLESGEANPTVGVLTRVADALQVRLEDLVSQPRASADLYPVESLPSKKRGKARIRNLAPDGTPALTIERLELEASGSLVGETHSSGTREYLACEKGEIEVAAAGHSWTLKAGDVLVLRGEVARSYKNCGRSRAITYSVVAFDPVNP